MTYGSMRLTASLYSETRERVWRERERAHVRHPRLDEGAVWARETALLDAENAEVLRLVMSTVAAVAARERVDPVALLPGADVRDLRIGERRGRHVDHSL